MCTKTFSLVSVTLKRILVFVLSNIGHWWRNLGFPWIFLIHNYWLFSINICNGLKENLAIWFHNRLIISFHTRHYRPLLSLSAGRLLFKIKEIMYNLLVLQTLEWWKWKHLIEHSGITKIVVSKLKKVFSNLKYVPS